MAVKAKLLDDSRSQVPTVGHALAAIFGMPHYCVTAISLPTDVPGISYVLFTGGTNDWNSYLEVACNWLDRELPSILQGHCLFMSRVYQKLRTFVQDLQSSLMLPLSSPKPPFGWIYLVRYLFSMRPSSINIIFVHLVTMTTRRIHMVCSFHVFWDARTESASSLLSNLTPSSHK